MTLDIICSVMSCLAFITFLIECHKYNWHLCVMLFIRQLVINVKSFRIVRRSRGRNHNKIRQIKLPKTHCNMNTKINGGRIQIKPIPVPTVR